MYTLGIPNRQYRRCTRVLGHESSKPIPYEAEKQEDGFYVFSFPEADEYDFKDIVHLLKRNGITTIGADDQLTERNIMKLTDLIKEQGNPDENEIIDKLKIILERWEAPDYKGGGEELKSCPRSDHYFEDLRELVEDYTENFYLDLDEPGSLNESKFQLKDFFINEQIDKKDFDVKIEIPGIEGETDVNIKLGNATSPFEDVTISWGDESYNVSFEEEEMVDDHGNEGQDWVFLAKHKDPDVEFRVDVAVEADYDQSGNIQEVDWDTLEVEFIKEGTMSDDEVDRAITIDAPESGQLQERFQKLAGLK